MVAVKSVITYSFQLIHLIDSCVKHWSCNVIKDVQRFLGFIIYIVLYFILWNTSDIHHVNMQDCKFTSCLYFLLYLIQNIILISCLGFFKGSTNHITGYNTNSQVSPFSRFLHSPSSLFNTVILTCWQCLHGPSTAVPTTLCCIPRIDMIVFSTN